MARFVKKFWWCCRIMATTRTVSDGGGEGVADLWDESGRGGHC